MYRSRLVPRIIPILGLIGAPLYLSAQVATAFGFNETQSIWSAIGLLPIFFWELSLGLWMTFKGFRKDAPLMIDTAVESTGLGPQAAATSPSALATTSGAA